MSRVRIPAFVLKKPPSSLAVVTVGSDAVLFLREDEWGMKRYPQRDCPVDLRLGTWEIEQVMLVAAVLRLARSDAATSDCQIDIGSPPGVRTLQCLAGQRQIDIHLVTDAVARGFRIANPLQLDASHLVNRIRSQDGWSPQAYDRALARLNTLYPTPHSLWRSCAQRHGTD